MKSGQKKWGPTLGFYTGSPEFMTSQFDSYIFWWNSILFSSSTSIGLNLFFNFSITVVLVSGNMRKVREVASSVKQARVVTWIWHLDFEVTREKSAFVSHKGHKGLHELVRMIYLGYVCPCNISETNAGCSGWDRMEVFETLSSEPHTETQEVFLPAEAGGILGTSLNASQLLTSWKSY